MLRRALLLAVLAAPLAALGQTISVVPKTSYTVAECDGTASTSLTVNWGMATGTVLPANGTYRILAATSDICPTDIAGTTAKVVASELAPNTSTSGDSAGLLGQRYPAIGDPALTLTTIKTLVAADCAQNPRIWLCVQLVSGTTTVTLTAKTQTVAIAVEGAPPVPVNVAVSPGENALNVSWADGVSNGVTPSGYRVTAAPYTGCPVPPATTPPCTLGSVVSTATTGAGTRSVRIAGLVNDQLYGVQVFARNGSGVESVGSAIANGTPINAYDYWEKYQAMGGLEEGGCAAGSAGALSLLAVAGLLRALRRRA